MTPKQIAKAYAYIEELSRSVFPYKVTRELVRLKNRLKEERDTILTMENALVEKYGGVVNKDRSFGIENEEDREKFDAEYAEFLDQDLEVRLPSVDLSKYTSSIRISAAAMEALEGLVAFEREERPAKAKEDD